MVPARRAGANRKAGDAWARIAAAKLVRLRRHVVQGRGLAAAVLALDRLPARVLAAARACSAHGHAQPAHLLGRRGRAWAVAADDRGARPAAPGRQAARSWDRGSQWYQTRAGEHAAARDSATRCCSSHPRRPGARVRFISAASPGNIGLIAGGSSSAARVCNDDPTLAGRLTAMLPPTRGSRPQDPGLDLFFHFDSTERHPRGPRWTDAPTAGIRACRPRGQWEADHAALAVTLLGIGESRARRDAVRPIALAASTGPTRSCSRPWPQAGPLRRLGGRGEGTSHGRERRLNRGSLLTRSGNGPHGCAATMPKAYADGAVGTRQAPPDRARVGARGRSATMAGMNASAASGARARGLAHAWRDERRTRLAPSGGKSTPKRKPVVPFIEDDFRPQALALAKERKPPVAPSSNT